MKSIISLVTIFTLVTMGFAQEAKENGKEKKHDAEKLVKKKVERFSETVELSEDKKAKLIQVLVDSREKGKEMKQSAEVSKEERAAFRKAHKENVESVLETDELIQAWREFNKKEKAKRRQAMKKRKAYKKARQKQKLDVETKE
jgi:hypothetical protein